MLFAVDEKLTTSTDVDLFRMKIRERDNGSVVYDNNMVESQDVEPTTAIRGGNIVIHKDK